MTLTWLYEAINHEEAPDGAALVAALRKLDRRRRRAIALRLSGLSYRELGEKLNVSHGAAQSVVELTLRALRKSVLDLPRYDQQGHPGPPLEARGKGRETRWKKPPAKKRKRPPAVSGV